MHFTIIIINQNQRFRIDIFFSLFLDAPVGHDADPDDEGDGRYDEDGEDVRLNVPGDDAVPAPGPLLVVDGGRGPDHHHVRGQDPPGRSSVNGK